MHKIYKLRNLNPNIIGNINCSLWKFQSFCYVMSNHNLSSSQENQRKIKIFICYKSVSSLGVCITSYVYVSISNLFYFSFRQGYRISMEIHPTSFRPRINLTQLISKLIFLFIANANFEFLLL